MTEQNPNAVHLWYTRCGAATASDLAIKKGWLQEEFAKPGTVLHSLKDSDSLAVRNSHYNHSRSGMFREGGNIPPIWAKGSGVDTVVVGISWLDEYQGILTRADSGIREVSDLAGKRLGIPLYRGAVIDFQRGAAQHGFETALRLAGLSKDDATWVDIETRAHDTTDGPRVVRTEPARNIELAALESGAVDAVFLRFARGYRASRDPRFHQLININDLPNPLDRVNNGTPRPVTVDRAFLEKHFDIVVRYLVVLLETAEWASRHPAEVIELLRQGSADIAAEDVIGSHGPHVHLSFEPKLTPEYIAGLEEQKNFLHRWGYFEHNFDIAEWVDGRALAEAHRVLERRRAEKTTTQAA